MSDSSSPAQTTLNFSQPVLAEHQVLFSAFELGWGFGAYAMSTSLVVNRLGAVDISDDSLRLAFHLNRERISDAVTQVGVSVPGKRVMLSHV